MRQLEGRRTLVWLPLVLAAGIGAPAPAHAQPLPAQTPPPVAAAGDSVYRVNSLKQNELTITERFSKVVEMRSRIVRVDGFDPAVVGVTALTPNQLRLQALAPGVTTLVIVDEAGVSWIVEVFVVGDVRHLQAYLSQMFPKSAVEAVVVRDAVVLRGWVTQPEHITEMVEIAEQFYPRVLNQMRVGGVQQVTLKVRVMEVQRSKIRRLGLNFLYGNRNGYLVGSPGALTPLGELTAEVPAGAAGVTPPIVRVAQAGLAGPQGAFGIVGDHNVFQGFIEALKEESLLKILAEPELTTTNGRPANMLAGGEFPILVPQSLGTTTIQWREFGVRLEAVPIILGNGRVRLELQPEVSDRDFTNAVQVNGLTVPGLTTRRVNTQVEMRFGETFMLAGLLSMRDTAQTSKVPFFGELPWIGAAFRRVRYDETETELVIMVTPELAAPVDPSTVPPGGPGLFTEPPLDRDLYRDGIIEVPRYSDNCVGGDCGPNGMGVPRGAGLPAAFPGPVVGDVGVPVSSGPVPRATVAGTPLPRGASTQGRPTGTAPAVISVDAPINDAPTVVPPPPNTRRDGGLQQMSGVRPKPARSEAPRPRGATKAPSRTTGSEEPLKLKSPGSQSARPGLIEPR